MNIVRRVRGLLGSRQCVLATIVAVAVAAGAFAAAYAQEHRAQTAYSTSNLVRLHIIANSDAEDDQAVKLAVRDRLAEEFSPVLSGIKTVDEAEEFIRKNLHLIEERAAEVVRKAGKSYSVRAFTGRFPFPPRVYGQIALPAGEYRALRVVLGSGEGQNWWCVMFPPLCFVDATGKPPPADKAAERPAMKSLVLEWLKGRLAAPAQAIDSSNR